MFSRPPRALVVVGLLCSSPIASASVTSWTWSFNAHALALGIDLHESLSSADLLHPPPWEAAHTWNLAASGVTGYGDAFLEFDCRQGRLAFDGSVAASGDDVDHGYGEAHVGGEVMFMLDSPMEMMISGSSFGSGLADVPRVRLTGPNGLDLTYSGDAFMDQRARLSPAHTSSAALPPFRSDKTSS